MKVEERDLTYGELLEKVKTRDLVVACSVGTAGILNRCARFIMVDNEGFVAGAHSPDVEHPLFKTFAQAREYYWDIYREKVKIPDGLRLHKYVF